MRRFEKRKSEEERKNVNRRADKQMKQAGEKRGKIEMVENVGRKPERHKMKEIWDKKKRKGNKRKEIGWWREKC